MDACRDLGVPLATAKCEGPTSCLTFLGIEPDTAAGAASACGQAGSRPVHVSGVEG